MSATQTSDGIRRAMVRMPLEDNSHDAQRLKVAAENTKDRLYVMCEGDWGTMDLAGVQKRLLFLYDELNRANSKLDARVLLPAPKAWLAPHALGIEAIFTSADEDSAVDSWNAERQKIDLPGIQKFPSSAPCPPKLQTLCWGADTCENLPSGCYDNVVLGGTFDRIHPGHKLLLSTSALYTKKRLAIGLSEGPLLAKKTLKEFMSSFTQRQVRLIDFLLSVRPGLDYHLVPITDPFGPSIVYPELDCIVVSKETEAGGVMVNERRVANGLNKLAIEVVDLVGPEHADNDTKVSSTQQRKNGLGVFCGEGTPPAVRAGGEEGGVDWVRLTDPAELPYIVAVTGGIASGKSFVSGHLASLGVQVLDCDKLGHRAYEKGSATFDKVVTAFGSEVVDEATGEINRRALGGIVFSPDKPDALPKLNSIVWPAIQELALAEMKKMKSDGAEVVAMEAAILLEAGWDSWVDEVWVVMVPEDVAKQRLMERNSLSEDDALKRIRSQMSNPERLAAAHVIVCNQWSLDSTKQQVAKAWEGVEWRRTQDLRAGEGGGGGGTSLTARWKKACTSLGVSPASMVAWWRRLRALYCGRGRFYHTLPHLRHMFRTQAELALPLQSEDLVAMAIFFHDAIYDPKSAENEAKSAELFRQFAEEAGGALSMADNVKTVASYILRTATHHSGPASGDLASLLDLDLAVLAAPPPLYDRYAEGILLEYSHLSYPEFLPKRIQVLEKMLGQESLFFSAEAKEKLDAPARANMRRELVWCKADLAKFPL